jgi:glycosyltransferase involved in cell wall biosynthesis
VTHPSDTSTVPSAITVSAIVAVRNAVDFVGRAIESIAAQSHPVDEIVVVDGQSTDGTLDVVASYPNVVVVPQPDEGLAAARNLGLAATSGSVVAFLDADDWWEPGKTARQVGLLGGASMHVVAGMMRRPGRQGVGTTTVETVPALTPGGLLVRRHVFDRVGDFDARYRIASDTEWLMRVRDAGLGPALHPDVVLHKGVRPESLSRDVRRYRAELMQVAREKARRSGGGTA